MAERSRNRAVSLSALAAACSTLLAGCGALTVAVEEQGSAFSVSVRDAEETAPTEEVPVEPPDGTVLRGITTDTCDVPIILPLPERWEQPQTYDSYSSFVDGYSLDASAALYLTCEPVRYEGDDPPANARSRVMTDDEYTVVAERRGTSGDTAYWIYAADTTGDEILGIGRPARVYGIAASPRHQGSTYRVELELVTELDNAAEVEQFGRIIEMTEVAGHTFDLPQVPAPGGGG